MSEIRSVEQWGVFDLEVRAAKLPDNPFTDAHVAATFTQGTRVVAVDGFYDGDGVYRVRFSPDLPGTWHYETHGTLSELDGRVGIFECARAAGDNHGPVRAEGHHFRHADGTPFFPLGTTAYAWTYQDEARVESTLESFGNYRFNKIRMLVFPKEYGTDTDLFRIDGSPAVLPFEGKPRALDFSRPNPEYFRRYERRIAQLRDRGVEADVILFHPYDVSLWGIPQGMTSNDDLLYVGYVCARFSAFRNVWWSLANEYDLFGISFSEGGHALRRKDWRAIGQLIERLDHVGHPRSIHNWTWGPIYPNEEWMTHVSYQHPNTWSLAIRLREEYGKPVIDDEYQYEGNVPNDYGNASAELEVKRHWMAFMAGAYATHGEMYVWDGDRSHVFWSTGGTLAGESPRRLSYLRAIMESVPFQDLSPNLRLSDGVDFFCLSCGEDAFVYFFGPGYKDRPGFQLGMAAQSETVYELHVHDVWQCRLVAVERLAGGHARLRRMPSWCVIVAERKTSRAE
ncbi:MAG: DUF4038 domain-containing protein [Spirochaetia bacterium]